MFVHENLKVGDKFYEVKEKNKFFQRKKIHKKIDGEDWFRYDIPLREYEIHTYTVKGILRKNLEGEWRYGDESDLDMDIYVDCDHGDGITSSSYIFTFYSGVSDNYEYFSDKNEAIAHMKELEKEALELDKK